MCWSFLPHVRFLILLTVFELLPKTCNFTICSIFSNSGHVGWCTASPDTILKLDTLIMIQTKFGFHWSSTFRGEDFWKSLRRTTDDGRRRRRRTQVMRIAHMTLWVRWAKKWPYKTGDRFKEVQYYETRFDCVWMQSQKSPNDPHIRIQGIIRVSVVRSNRIWEVSRNLKKNYAHVSFVNLTPIWTPFKTKNGYQFSLKSENIEILPILSAANLKMAAIRSRFFLVRIFYQPYLIYMPSLVEIPLAVSDISEVKEFDICS